MTDRKKLGSIEANTYDKRAAVAEATENLPGAHIEASTQWIFLR